MGGIGVFFGVFNPMHMTHVRLAHDLMNKRGLSKVYVHCTVVPKADRDALAAGEIRVAGHKDGRIVYETTALANPEKNYFRTGNEFYAYETRRELAKLALLESGSDPRIVVLDMPDVYEHSGFAGIVRAVRAMHPGESVHAIHGDDVGGLLLKMIYEREGVETIEVKRDDGVSAAAIRAGELGLSTSGVDAIVTYLRFGVTSFQVNGRQFRFEGMKLMPAIVGARRAVGF